MDSKYISILYNLSIKTIHTINLYTLFMNICLHMSNETIKPSDVQPMPKELNPLNPMFTLKPVKKKPARKYRKGSKYDPILDAFIKGSDKLVSVTVENKDANYIRTQLNKRIEARELKNVKVSVVNNVTYLEKNNKKSRK